MKDMGEMLLRREGFSEIVIGNTALVRAMVESGVGVVTSYPGSPTPEIAAAIASMPAAQRPFYFEFSVNEKVATEVAFGSALNGHLAVVFFKSVGLNVAADTFVQLPLMEITGGMVVVLGDDPGAHSSQNEQDNRHFAHLAYLPVFEPATAAETYAMFKEAAALARAKKTAVIMRLTTHVCHAKEKVAFAPYAAAARDNTPLFDVKNGPYVPIAAAVFPMKRRALQKLEQFREYADDSPFNMVFSHNNKKRGVVTCGTAYLALADALAFAGDRPDVLKLGLSHPLPRRLLSDFLQKHEEILVLEELDNILENEIRALAQSRGLASAITGKQDLEDWIGEYTPERVAAKLDKVWPDLLAPRPEPTRARPAVPPRPPQLCPGCGHRSAFHAVKNALAVGDITVADIGCHSLGFLPPYEMGQVLLCMGASTAAASGLALANRERKVVAFLGDSTFFHAGIPGIINAVFNRHNLTLIIMENGTTAMTGHQEHPATGKNFNGPTTAIPLRRVLESLGIANIRELDAYSQKKLTAMVKEALAEEGFKVIIARHPCMLKHTREQKRQGTWKGIPVRVNQEKCRRIHECVSVFACPSYQIDEGGRVHVQEDLCIGDGSCLQTCPAAAIETGNPGGEK
ncbi:MAG TPA: thiamine pyrophosphate-dependent enzyme [Patescibacteria group bacterium]|nr:thiamine pyrophosphate-dependent enzyme [Patescibacteria group bacterium]